MIAADDEDLSQAYEMGREMMTSGQFFIKFLRRVDGRVDRAMDLLFSGFDDLHNFSQGDIANDHEVEVTTLFLLTAGNGAVKKSGIDAANQRL